MPIESIFVDTSTWFALLVPNDPDHQKTRAWISKNNARLITTDYVVDESLTLLMARGQAHRAQAFGKAMFDGSMAPVHFVTEGAIREAFDIFVQFSDKEWSFTDCTSKVIIDRLGIKKGLRWTTTFCSLVDCQFFRRQFACCL